MSDAVKNELKEEIKADAEIRVYHVTSVHPVSNVRRVHSYQDKEKNKGRKDRSFSDVLTGERKKVCEEPSEPKEENLRWINAKAQYNRMAKEVYFVLPIQTDYRA